MNPLEQAQRRLNELSTAIFGDRFPSDHHARQVTAAFAAALASRGPDVFDQPAWYIGTDDGASFQVAPNKTGRFNVRVIDAVSWKDAELFRSGIRRAADDGKPTDWATLHKSVGYLPSDDVAATIAHDLLTQIARKAVAAL
jgi:hypothetical protein